MSPADCLPTDLSALAVIAADTGRPLPDRQLAMTALTEVVLAIARRALARYRGLLPVDDMIHAAPGEVWERLAGHFPSPARPFRGWCLRVIRNWASDACRAARRDPLRAAGPLPPQDPAREPPVLHGEALLDEAEALRSVLDETRSANWFGREVDFYSVLLVHLRLTLAARAADAYLADGPPGVGHPPDLAADWASGLIPWHEAEERRQFRPGWPEVRLIWSSVCAALLEPPYRVEGGSFCNLVTVLLAGAGELSLATWYQWVRRARDRAEELIPPNDWQTWFAPFLAVRRGASRAAGLPGATT